MSEASCPAPRPQIRKRHIALKVLTWLVVGILILFALVYARLLVGPISLDFLSDRAKSAIAGIVGEDFAVDWSDFGLSLNDPLSVGFHLANVTLTERQSEAVIQMEALEISLAPIGAAFGRPDARVILVQPRIQLLQNLLGPRLSRFEFIEDEGTGETVARVLEGASTAPNVRIGDHGLSLGETVGADEIGLRSDNDWLRLNLETLDASLAGLASQAMDGQIRRFEIRDGTIGILDTVYGLYRSFDSVDLDVRAGREDGRVSALFSADIAGDTMDASIVRQIAEDETRIAGAINNFDFSTIIPFLDDASGLAALRGTGNFNLEVGFDRQSGQIRTGTFEIGIDETHLRLNNDLFEISADPIAVTWDPRRSLFSIAESEVEIGQTRAIVGGDIVVGFDEQFGPTLGMSVRARDIWLHPDDLEAPGEAFETFSFEGWSAPLYGAIGIDRMVAARGDVSVVMQGRIDMVREGLGMDVSLSGHGASADDVKRLWPYLFAREGREWFTQMVGAGRVETADMRFRFPVGSIDMEGQGGRVPEGAMSIELVGSDLELAAIDGLPQFEVEGRTRLSLRDNQLTVSMDKARLPDYAGIGIANAAYINQDLSASDQVFEVSGDISGPASALLRLASGEGDGFLEGLPADIDLGQLARTVDGQVRGTAIATIGTDDSGQMTGVDYALNGTISDLSGTYPATGTRFSDGGLSFTASQEGFRIRGQGLVEDMPLEIQAIKERGREPDIAVASTFDVRDLNGLGIDLSDYVDGSLRLTGRPLADGGFDLEIDLADAALTLSDVGISKSRGAAGTLAAVIGIDGEKITASDIALAFGTVRLEGAVNLVGQNLQSADFTTFQISPGDSARVAMAPIEGGYSLSVEGTQLDIKPVLGRFFNLDGSNSASASGDLDDQIFAVHVNLDRALGHYGEIAFNVDLDLTLRGDQVNRLNLTTQFLGNRSASATTNPLPNGRVINYATNDLGAMMRFIGVYPRLVGGQASMVMRFDQAANADSGAFEIRNFAVVDENNLDAIIASHDESRRQMGGVSAMEFDYGRAQFIRYPDRIEVIDGAIYGEVVGGTIRGNVLTDSGAYDLAGTYVPLFGVNNFFQQLPLVGPIFGGREGEGLLGVTFAVRGPLGSPDLLINPVSILAPGVFRSLFEYRAANQAN